MGVGGCCQGDKINDWILTAKEILSQPSQRLIKGLFIGHLFKLKECTELVILLGDY